MSKRQELEKLTLEELRQRYKVKLTNEHVDRINTEGQKYETGKGVFIEWILHFGIEKLNTPNYIVDKIYNKEDN